MAIDPNKFKVYAERDVSESQVNWADAAKTITSDIEKIRDERELKKAAIETSTQATMKDLRKLEPVKNQQLGELALKGSNQSADYLMMQNTLLKNGHISPTDYMVGLQNQKDQWSNFSGAVKNWNAADVAARERLDAGDSSQMEWYMNEQNESFGNVNNIQTFIDPETGEMSIIQLDENGQIPLLANGEPDRSAYMNVNSLNVRMNDQVDRVDLIQDIVPDVNTFATFIESNWDPGKYGSRVEMLDDARQAPAYKKYLDGIVKKYTADPRQVVSILADNEGGYEFTQDPAEQGGNMILLEPDSRGFLQPSLTDDQTAAAEGYIRTTIEGQVDHLEEKKGTWTEEAMTPEEKIRVKQAPADDKEVSIDFNNMKDLISAEPGTAGAVGDSVVGVFNQLMSPGSVQIASGGLQRNTDGFVFTLEDDTTFAVEVFEPQSQAQIDANEPRVQLPDDVIVQEIAQKLGISETDVRAKFVESGVDLGEFNPEAFTTEKSEAALKAPNYGLGVDRTDPTGSAKPDQVISEALGDMIRSVMDPPSQVQSTYLGLINRYWDTEELGGVDLKMTNGDEDITITIGGEDYTIRGVYGRSSMDVWQEIKNVEAEARRVIDKKLLSGSGAGTGELD